jgi:plastocyanin
MRRRTARATGAAAIVATMTITMIGSASATSNVVNDYVVASTFAVGTLAQNAPSDAVRIHTGDTVVWTNLDPIAHDVTFKARSYPLRSLGGQARRTFPKSGAFRYRCTIHPGMNGLVYVSDGGLY